MINYKKLFFCFSFFLLFCSLEVKSKLTEEEKKLGELQSGFGKIREKSNELHKINQNLNKLIDNNNTKEFNSLVKKFKQNIRDVQSETEDWLKKKDKLIDDFDNFSLGTKGYGLEFTARFRFHLGLIENKDFNLCMRLEKKEVCEEIIKKNYEKILKPINNVFEELKEIYLKNIDNKDIVESYLKPKERYLQVLLSILNYNITLVKEINKNNVLYKRRKKDLKDSDDNYTNYLMQIN